MHDEPQRPELPLEAPGVRHGLGDDVAPGCAALLGVGVEAAFQADRGRVDDLAVERGEGRLVRPHLRELVHREPGGPDEGARVEVPARRGDDGLAIGKASRHRPARAPAALEGEEAALLAVLLQNRRHHVPPHECDEARELRPEKRTRKQRVAALEARPCGELALVQLLRAKDVHPHAPAPGAGRDPRDDHAAIDARRGTPDAARPARNGREKHEARKAPNAPATRCMRRSCGRGRHDGEAPRATEPQSRCKTVETAGKHLTAQHCHRETRVDPYSHQV